MKNYFLLALCVSLLFVGCEKDDGFRAVSIEVELGEVQVSLDSNETSYVGVNVSLSSEDPDTELSLEEYSTADNGAVPKKVVKSEDVIWAVGTNVRRGIYSVGRLGADYPKLPCDVTIRIKADNKVIWSYSAKKGDEPLIEDANLIIR
jgi:hypothetical protein